MASTLYCSGYANWFLDYQPLCTLSKLPDWWNHECWVTFNKMVLYITGFFICDLWQGYTLQKTISISTLFSLLFPNALLRIPWHNWPIRWLLNLDINLESNGREGEMAFCHPDPDVYLYINVQSFVFNWSPMSTA